MNLIDALLHAFPTYCVPQQFIPTNIYIYTHSLWKSSLNRLSNNAEQKHDKPNPYHGEMH